MYIIYTCIHEYTYVDHVNAFVIGNIDALLGFVEEQ